MDHTSLASVVSAAKHLLDRKTVLDGQVNNTDTMASSYEMTKDGYEI
jgi:hypothetical protein